jgi:DNA-binding CsgD family transcriptional regulator
MSEAPPGLALVCRRTERDTINRFLTAADTPSALVIEGEAGMGKSTLWSAGLSDALALGQVVLRVRPAQAEAKMSFAGLGDLLDPVADTLLPELNAPQREVLEVALLRRLPSASPPTEREIGAAMLAGLRLLAGGASVVVAIDDVQWLDRASAEVLAYALRRLGDGPIRTMITRRTSDGPAAGEIDVATEVLAALDGLSPSIMTLGPLPDVEVAHLVRARIGPLPSAAAERGLVTAAAGNPYWALELGRAIAQAGDDYGGELRVPATLSTLLNRRLLSQPDDVRSALLVVAALSRPTWGTTSRALAAGVADPDGAIDAAVAAGLVTETTGRLSPSHPLLAAAALQALTPGRRHRLHRQLADLSADPEQRARHLALATDGDPDAYIAQSLEIGAGSARSRGALHTAAELADLAVELSPPVDRVDVSRRRLVAAELWFTAGDLVRACELAEDIVRDDPNLIEWAILLPLLVESTYWVRGQHAAQLVLRRILDDPEPDRRRRAVALACAADVGDGLGTSRGQLARESIALFDDLGDTDPGAMSIALVYLAEEHLDAGHGIATEVLARAEAAEARHQQAQPRSIPVLNRVRSVHAYQLKLVDDLDGARSELLYALGVARSEGDEASVPAVLGHLALTEYWAGNYRAGLEAADEGLARAAATGGVTPATLYAARALLAAETGDLETARRIVASQFSDGSDSAPSKKTIAYQHVLGLAEMLERDNGQALHHLDQAWAAAQTLGIHEPGRRQRLEGDLGQTLIADGQLERAAALAADLRSIGQRADRPTLLGIGLRLDGLIHAVRGDLDAAAETLDAAVVAHRRSPLALELPRTQLALGQVHRRRRATQLARAHLQAATDRFAVLGATSWVHLAQDELRRLRGTHPGAKLTATEDRIASLAAGGRSNREIAAELFISPRTVEGHLAATYRKLSIRGRSELPRDRTASPEGQRSESGR